MLKHIHRDLQSIKERDPAARSTLEIILTYPGLHALWFHRVDHWLFVHGLRLLARIGSHIGRLLTGIEIHPGATIGEGFFVDHGMGVVIGETTEIGDNVTLYQGVTLGGTGKERGKRHPTIRDNVVVGVGAKILGGIEIGEGSKIGAGAVVLDSVPPHSTAVGVPARVVVQGGKRVEPIDLHHERLPDPVLEMFTCLQHRIERLQRLVEGSAADRWADKVGQEAVEATASVGQEAVEATASGANEEACEL